MSVITAIREAVVKEAGSLKQEDVIKALAHARIAEGPVGPVEMEPGQPHVRMNMYIAQANKGNFRIVKSLGVIDPKECMQGLKQANKIRVNDLLVDLSASNMD